MSAVSIPHVCVKTLVLLIEPFQFGSRVANMLCAP